MIARTWHGAVRSEDAERVSPVPARHRPSGLQRAAGNRGVYVFRRVEGDVAHFLLLTLWESWDAIRASREATRKRPVTTRKMSASCSSSSPPSPTTRC